MAAIGLLAHEERPQAVELEDRTARWLERLGHEARRLKVGDHPGVAGSEALAGLDVVVSLGGDGTMLRTVRLAAPVGVPVLGVNLGHLGYLTALEPDKLEAGLERFLAGDYTVDSRMTLEVCRRRAGSPRVLERHLALNDAVLQRPADGHTIQVAVAVNGHGFVSFVADALIVATATGSTAYNLSARGPIVSPLARVQIITPVAPHSLFDRSLVLGADERITLALERCRAADLVLDGLTVAEIADGELIEVTAGKDVHLVTFEERVFAEILMQKFALGDS